MENSCSQTSKATCNHNPLPIPIWFLPCIYNRVHTHRFRLIIALLEWWIPETHTFHLPNGEFTITLEDVSMLLGLPVDGKAVNGPSELGGGAWSSILGDEPPQSDKGMTARLTWLKDMYQHEPPTRGVTRGV